MGRGNQQRTLRLGLPYTNHVDGDATLDFLDGYIIGQNPDGSTSFPQGDPAGSVFSRLRALGVAVPEPQVTGTVAETTLTSLPFGKSLLSGSALHVHAAGLCGSHANGDVLIWRLYLDAQLLVHLDFTNCGVDSTQSFDLDIWIVARTGQRVVTRGRGTVSDSTAAGSTTYFGGSTLIGAPTTPWTTIKSAGLLSTTNANCFLQETVFTVGQL